MNIYWHLYCNGGADTTVGMKRMHEVDSANCLLEVNQNVILCLPAIRPNKMDV